MSIWEYDHSRTEKEVVKQAYRAKECLFCAEPLVSLNARLPFGGFESRAGMNLNFEIRTKDVRTCPVCGWWTVMESFVFQNHSRGMHRNWGAVGSLRELDLPNLDLPLEEIRSYLAARYASRFHVHPRAFEEIVASVFRDLGYGARVTAYSGDDGLDVLLDGPSDVLIGVQVKRYRNSIEVEQIRSLTGALVLGGLTRGIFVTTSTFQKGAEDTAERVATRGYQIELMNADRFYDALKIAQRSRYQEKNDPAAPYTHAKLIEIYSDDSGRAYAK
jgi:restriction system protein